MPSTLPIPPPNLATRIGQRIPLDRWDATYMLKASPERMPSSSRAFGPTSALRHRRPSSPTRASTESTRCWRPRTSRESGADCSPSSTASIPPTRASKLRSSAISNSSCASRMLSARRSATCRRGDRTERRLRAALALMDTQRRTASQASRSGRYLAAPTGDGGWPPRGAVADCCQRLEPLGCYRPLA